MTDYLNGIASSFGYSRTFIGAAAFVVLLAVFYIGVTGSALGTISRILTVSVIGALVMALAVEIARVNDPATPSQSASQPPPESPTPTSPSPPPPPNLYGKIGLLTFTFPKTTLNCVGMIVSPRYVMTATACQAAKASDLVFSQGNLKRRVHYDRTDRVVDLLRIDGDTFPEEAVLNLHDTREPAAGETVFVMARTADGASTGYKKCKVKKIEANTDYFWHECNLSNDLRGALLVNESDERVAGMHYVTRGGNAAAKVDLFLRRYRPMLAIP